MQHVLVMGAGKIGTLIAFLLANSNDYHVYLADINIEHRTDLVNLTNELPQLELLILDARDSVAITKFLQTKKIDAVIPSLPYYYNIPIAKIAREFNLHYFDLTEDTATSKTVFDLAQEASSAFVPQCGLAPGFISIVSNQLMKNFTQLDTVKMRVGALPINTSNALQYALTWSTDGLINEYGNRCHAIEDGAEIDLLPLEGLENIKIDGLTYEAFNTSGGIGTLANTYQNKIQHLNYKTIRYPGHCEKMIFLMNDLNLNADRETLKRILEQTIPKTYQDVVLVYVSVTGTQDGQYMEENYVKKFYPKVINGMRWSAIQLTTACAITAILDTVLQNSANYRGFIRQEEFTLETVLTNRFGKYYA